MIESAHINKPDSKQYFLPDLADMLFLLILYLVLILKSNMLLADGSTAWHLVCGNYILQHHQIPHNDLMSYTFAAKPWVAYEWLSDLFMACLVKLGGLNLLNIVSGSAIALLISLLYKRCRLNGCNFLLAAFLTITGAFVSAIHWLARPHLFTFFGVFIFITLLDRYYHELISKRKIAIALTCYMLIWVNCHPGFLLGFVLIGIYLVSCCLDYLFFADSQRKNIKREQGLFLLLLLALNMVASLCNPYSYHLYSYISHYLLKSNIIIGATDEFLSPIFHGALQPFLLELLFALTIIGCVISKRKMTLPTVLIYLLFAHLSLAAQRNMALYVIAALPIIAGLYTETEINSQTGFIYTKLKPIWQGFIDKFKTLDKRFTENENLCSYHLLPKIVFLALVVISLNGGKVFGHTFLQSEFDKGSKPSTTLAVIKQLGLDPKHGFALDNWGGIIKYQIDYPVFIDDRADFYGEDFYFQYAKIIQTSPGWQQVLSKYQIEWILLPPGSRLIEELKADSHWRMAAQDKASVLLIKKS